MFFLLLPLLLVASLLVSVLVGRAIRKADEEVQAGLSLLAAIDGPAERHTSHGPQGWHPLRSRPGIPLAGEPVRPVPVPPPFVPFAL